MLRAPNLFSPNNRHPSRTTSRRLSQHGSVMVEATFALSVFFFIIFSGADLAILWYRGMTLQHTVATASRWGSLNLVLEDPNNPGSFLSRADSVVLKTQTEGRRFGLDLSGATTTICPLQTPSCPDNTKIAGGSNEMVEIRVALPKRFLFGSAVKMLRARAVVKNEP